MTKIHEECRWVKISELLKIFEKQRPKGEIVLVLKPEPKESLPPSKLDEEIKDLLKQDLGPKELSQKLASKYGLSRKEVYQRILSFKKSKEFKDENFDHDG